KGSQAAVGSAIRMQHQDHGLGLVQPHGDADLVQNELALALLLRRRQALGASSNADGIVIGQSQVLYELAQRQLEPVVKAPHDGGMGRRGVARRIEMEGFMHSSSSRPRLAKRVLEAAGFCRSSFAALLLLTGTAISPEGQTLGARPHESNVVVYTHKSL